MSTRHLSLRSNTTNRTSDHSSSVAPITYGTCIPVMADDLDAFFDEVEEVAAKAEGEEEPASIEPPKKKAKPTVIGVVVASASEKKKIVEETPKEKEGEDEKAKKVPPPPPPPPPPPATNQGAMAPIGPLPTSPPPVDGNHASGNNKTHVRTAAGKTWVDPTLEEWPENDFRIFVGNLDPTVTDEQDCCNLFDDDIITANALVAMQALNSAFCFTMEGMEPCSGN
eukprot:scaffold2357_cov167-Amphora_coffeaeformis.AAC.11